MLSLESIGSIIDDIADKFGTRLGITYRLPAPIASTPADNTLWSKLLNVHPWHMHPKDILNTATSVIVFAIPLSYEAIESNTRDYNEPSLQWLREYLYTNRLIQEIVQHISKVLESMGYTSKGLNPTHDYNPSTLRSSWSHRHAGYVCSLGTFGLNNLLITSKGCAVRLGTIITEAKIEETERPTFEYCLEKRGIKCKKCIERCPIRALTNWDKGRFECNKRLTEIALKYKNVLEGYADACGKCSTGIPCATRIP